MRGTIVYQDDDLLVVHKPAGQVVHPAHANPSGTLWDDLRAYFACMGLPGQPGLVHRLDKDTSGLLVVAKNPPPTATCIASLPAARSSKATSPWWTVSRPRKLA